MPKLFAGDSAVLAGSAVAAPGIWFSGKFGDPYFDLGAPAVIGLILICAVVVLNAANGGLLSRKRINWTQIARLREIISADPAIENVGHLTATGSGSDGTLLTATVRFKHPLNQHELEQAIGRLERSICKQHPYIRHLRLESPSRMALSQHA